MDPNLTNANDSTTSPDDDLTAEQRELLRVAREEILASAAAVESAAGQPTPTATSAASAAPAPLDTSRLMVNFAVVAVVFLGIGVLIGRLIFGGAGMNIEEVENAVKRALAESGGIGGGGVDTPTANYADDDPGRGPSTAAVTLVEFSDFNCSFCTRFATQTLPRLMDHYGENVRFVYRDMPIIGGQTSVETAIAAECAADSDKFWEFHNLLFSNNSARTRDAYVSFAGELGLDTTAYTACLDSKEKSDEVLLDMLDGQGLNITGTPAFYINGRFVSGAQPFEVFQTVIDAELRKVGITPPA